MFLTLPAFQGLSPSPYADTIPFKLKKIDVLIGTDEEVVEDMMVTVYYTGWLYDKSFPGNKGNKFDSSPDRN